MASGRCRERVPRLTWIYDPSLILHPPDTIDRRVLLCPCDMNDSICVPLSRGRTQRSMDSFRQPNEVRSKTFAFMHSASWSPSKKSLDNFNRLLKNHFDTRYSSTLRGHGPNQNSPQDIQKGRPARSVTRRIMSVTFADGRELVSVQCLRRRGVILI